jgi:perosamine synthetase
MIPVNEPLLDGNERKYVNECLDTGWISSEGPFLKRFEEEFALLTGRRHAVAVTNGSVALDAAVEALGIEKGAEVMLPSFTIISCAAAIVRAGLVPVPIDADPITYNIDVGRLEAALTPRSRAIMVVHIYGLPCDMDPILAFALRHGLRVIEDAAEMHGQAYRGRACGSFGDVSTFSFYPNKHVTTGEGGMIVTDSDTLAEKCRGLRNLCFMPGRRFVHEELGYNMRMTNLQAALGVAQLERLTEFVARKRRMGQLYTELLDDIPTIQLPLAQTDYARNIYWVYGIILGPEVPFDATEAMKRLAAKGVGTRPFFWPMHEQPVLRRLGFCAGVQCPVAERIARRGFYVPSGMALSEAHIRDVARAVREVLH